MGKIIFWVIVAIVLTVLFGTWPLSVLAKVFEGLAWVIAKAAKILDVFNWNGILKIGGVM